MENQPQAPQQTAAELAQQEADAHFARVQADRETEARQREEQARQQYLDTLYKQPFETDDNPDNWKAEHDRYNQTLAGGSSEHIEAVQETINGNVSLRSLEARAKQLVDTPHDETENMGYEDRKSQFLADWHRINDRYVNQSNPNFVADAATNDKESQALTRILNEAGFESGTVESGDVPKDAPMPRAEDAPAERHVGAETSQFLSDETAAAGKERAFEQFNERRGAVPNHAEDHHLRIQDSKRPGNTEEANAVPVSVTTPERVESDPKLSIEEKIKGNLKLKELQMIAKRYGEAKALETEEKDGLEQRYKELMRSAEEGGEDSSVLNYIATHVEPSSERLEELKAHADHFDKTYRNPSGALDKTEVVSDEPSREEKDDIPDSEPAEVSPATEDDSAASSLIEKGTDSSETQREKLTWRQRLDVMRGEVRKRLSKDRFSRIYDLKEVEKRYNDRESIINRRVKPDAPEEEKKQQRDTANIHREMGVTARMLLADWIDRKANRIVNRLLDKRLQDLNQTQSDAKAPAGQVNEGEK